ncbi:uncharacterized protein BP01DRAFT_392850 [Aspergillus saccharolyticus JOP 1030-1]|uniref:Uncharacterized protein n=1 Tax=Aspergillus saccharolyticus JOP 1030-1 TaxID=1450539 RepID=A0A318Z9V0_9EURO|nr:hypothetical protein BP01DRAFT_392850 [Aspergillus saccharolyticus JOP 1030-1]PYH44019.1 hypothetical protein BP01DRAFT_392850 [Aspergillus saccharolyticus JOP 1030-1]
MICAHRLIDQPLTKIDGFEATKAPQAYQDVKPSADLFVLGMGLGYTINSISMVHVSFRDQTLIEQAAAQVSLGINFAIIYAAIKHALKERHHRPLV